MRYNRITIAILDEHTLFRKFLKHYFSDNTNISVVIQSSDVTDLLKKLKDCDVQLLLIDVLAQLHMGAFVKLIRQEYPEIKILVLTSCTNMELLSELLELGVHGYFSKSDEPEELIDAIESLAERRLYPSKMFTEIMYWNKERTVKTKVNTTTALLNEREKEIIKLLWEEKSNKEIANHLYLSVRSIEKIRQDLKEKVGVKSTVGLLKYAINKKVIGSQTNAVK